MTNADIAKQARAFANDSEPYKPDDSGIAKFIDMAIVVVVGMRIDAIFDNTGVITIATTPSDLSGDCSLADKWFLPVTRYVSYLMFTMEGGQQKDDKQAAAHLQAFKETLAMV